MSILALIFLRPELLLLLLLLPLLWFLPRRLEDAAQGMLRTLIFGFLILALAGPVQIHESTREHQVLILDLSASVDIEDRLAASKALSQLVDSMDKRSQKSLLVLADEPLMLERKDRARFTSIVTHEASLSLATALDQASRLIPDGAPGAITLVSDGLSTDQDWGLAMQTLSARGIPLHTLALASTREPRITGVVVPSVIRVGKKAVLEVRLSARQARVRLILSSKANRYSLQELARLEDVNVRGETVARLEFTPKEAGFLHLELRAQLEGDAQEKLAERPQNAALHRELWVAVQDPLRVLYLGGRLEGGADKLSKLLGPGFDLAQSSRSESAPNLAAYDLVVLDDIAEKQIPAAFQKTIVETVKQQGLGLVMSGGRNAFGPGGWQKSPVAKLLPVDLAQKEEKKDPSTALAVIIDTSGSMGGNRITLAKEVARLAIRRLLPHDKVGIVEFYGTKHWAAPLQSAANAIEIQRALNRLDAGGGTILFPAVQEAYYGLRNVQTRYKHVLILTDAGVESGPYENLLRRMARDGMRVSTVLVGPGRHSEFLVELADWGKGRYYNASDRFNLPEVLLKQPSSSRLPAYRPGPIEIELRGGPGWWGQRRPESLPALDGYVETRTRTGSEVLIKTKREGHPVLATWRYGLGRVTSLATEPVGPGSRSLDSWPDYGAFLGRVLARTARDRTIPYRLMARRSGTRVEVSAVALETQARGVGRPVLWLAGEEADEEPGDRGGDEGQPHALRFHEAAPGLYVSRFTASRDAPLRFLLAQSSQPEHGIRLVLAPHSDRSPELQVDPDQGMDLALASKTTGGEHLSLTDLSGFGVRTGGAQRPLALRDFAPWALLLALLFLLLEILWRRLPSRPQARLIRS